MGTIRLAVLVGEQQCHTVGAARLRTLQSGRPGRQQRGIKTNCWVSGSLVGPPLVHTFWNCLGGGQLLGGHMYDPLPAGLRKSQGAGCNLVLSHNNLHYGAAGDYALWDFGPYRIPGMQPTNWNDGARLHTLIGATELTALYYNDNMNGGFPVARFGGPNNPYYTN